MENTEMMKRYEAETGKQALTYIMVHVSVDGYDYGELVPSEEYNNWLEAQLRWRPVSEKPKEGQIVFAMIQTGWVVAQYLHGEFYVDDGFTFGDRISGVINWLPIPPAPEGE